MTHYKNNQKLFINKLVSYKDETNISQVNNDLPFNIKASAYKNTVDGKYESLKKEKTDKKYVDNALGLKVDKSSFSYDSLTEILTITIS